MNDDTVKVTLDVPKVLRKKIRIAAAQKDRTVAAEIREALVDKYMVAAEEPTVACGEV